MARLLVFVVLFILFTVIKLIIKGASVVKEVGEETFDTVYGDGSKRNEIPESLSHGIVGLLTKVAKSDGQISDMEAAILVHTIDQFVEMVPASYQIAFRSSLLKTHEEAKQLDNLDHYLLLVRQHRSEKEMITTLVQQMVGIATVDGMSAEKKAIIHKAAEWFGIDRYLVDSWIASVETESHRTEEEPTTHADTTHAYAILGVDENDSFDTIKRRYRELVKKFHPDTIQAQGLDETFVEFAKQKMQEINRAFSIIKETRGMVAA